MKASRSVTVLAMGIINWQVVNCLEDRHEIRDVVSTGTAEGGQIVLLCSVPHFCIHKELLMSNLMLCPTSGARRVPGCFGPRNLAVNTLSMVCWPISFDLPRLIVGQQMVPGELCTEITPQGSGPMSEFPYGSWTDHTFRSGCGAGCLISKTQWTENLSRRLTTPTTGIDPPLPISTGSRFHSC